MVVGAIIVIGQLDNVQISVQTMATRAVISDSKIIFLNERNITEIQLSFDI